MFVKWLSAVLCRALVYVPNHVVYRVVDDVCADRYDCAAAA